MTTEKTPIEEAGAMTFPRWFIAIAGVMGSWVLWASWTLVSIQSQVSIAVKAADQVQTLNIQFIQETGKRERLEDKYTTGHKDLEDKISRLEVLLGKLQK